MELFDPADPRPVHFMGIAGAGMSALALIARRRGIPVTGCDLSLRDATDVIEAGATVVEGHDPGHVREARAVIRTAAVPADHPEIVAAEAAGVPVVKRAEALARLVAAGRVIGIAGTHGKTTTTAMTTEALAATGSRPTGLVGGRISSWGGNAWIDGEGLFVVEADEYDRSFLALHPSIAVINNVEADHLECYGTLGALEAAFAEFGNRADRVLIGADDAGANRVRTAISAPTWSVGLAPGADVRIVDPAFGAERTRATIVLPDARKVPLELHVPGMHNLRNAAMALGVVAAVGADMERARDALAAFAGVGRRFEVLGTVRSVTVVDDYAHHPSEVSATINAARQRFPGRPLVVVFQPHLYSRTRTHAEALGAAVAGADRAMVMEVYPAREAPIPGVSSDLVIRAARNAGGTVVAAGDEDSLPVRLAQELPDGAVVLCLGAGSITTVAHRLMAELTAMAA